MRRNWSGVSWFGDVDASPWLMYRRIHSIAQKAIIVNLTGTDGLSGGYNLFWAVLEAQGDILE
jgi:hypothetical protein